MVKVRILASKRLTKSFNKLEGLNTWESIPFEQDEAVEIVAGAVRRLSPDAEPLTITITPIEKIKK
jgi:hypothetical protein